MSCQSRFVEVKVKIIKISEVPKKRWILPVFTGSDITKQELLSGSKDFEANIVNFGKGMRNKFHAHASDQILIVTAGKGIVTTEGEERVVTAGDVIFFPADEKHRHGATEGSEFSHIYIVRKGSKTTRLED